jgi:hypothetical protein
MKKKRPPRTSSRGATTTTIGRARFAKISAVEGIVLTPEMERRVAHFDRAGLSARERRESIIIAHRKA